MLNRVKTRSIGFWLELVGGVLAIVTLVMGMTQNALVTNTNFDVPTVVLLILGAVLAIAGFFVDFDFWALLPAACFFVALGLVAIGGAPVIADWFNKVVYSGGNLSCVIAYLSMLGASSLLSIAACYLPASKKN
ncbi:MAG: hypothetical protein J6D37_06610 [Clostridia bacterium]|nr:hypothetical protein [Clostridia bacterium]